MRLRPWASALAAGACALALTTTFAPAALSAPKASSNEDVRVYRVKTRDPLAAADALAAAGYDLLETRIGGDIAVVGTADVGLRLVADGYQAVVHETWTGAEMDARSARITASTFYGGYRTADEYDAYLDQVAAQRPDLAVVHDIGDTWLKAQGSAAGNDLKAICITKLSAGDCQLTPTSSKPRFLLIGSVHARELTPSELAARWVGELTGAYGTDAEITSIVDSTELWVVPLANPDGREIVESGGNTPYLQRKNANGSAGGSCANPPTASSHIGVDLNRNHAFLWGGVGTSTDPCAQTYKGVGAASEPETLALQSLMTALFPDQRGPAITDAAPTTTPGFMMTVHSYGNLMLFPWGHVNTASPNDAGLRSLGFRLSYYNNYTAGQPGQVLYNTSGTTDDWLYGTLGIAAATMEVGPNSGSCSGFVPAFSCQDSFWTTNRPMLVQAAKLAREPYRLALGPQTRSVALSSTTVPAGAAPTLTATASDSAYGSAGVSRPSSQTVNAGEYYVDTPPWAAGTARAMTPSDRRWNSTTEGVTATVATTGLASGTHTLYVRARDASSNWGPVSAVRLTVQ